MADRRPDDSGSAQRGQEDLTQRINTTYASSGPVQSGTTDAGARSATPGKPTGAERFAAVRAASDSGATAKAAAKTPERRVRKAHLRLTHVDPWSVMKTSFLFSVALGIVIVVAVAVVWGVLGAAGIWDSIDATVADVVGQTGDSFRIEDYLGTSRVMGFTMIVAAVDVVLVTVIGTLGAFLYNLAAALLGGIEVVLAEDER
jgi:hypothetical protein